MTSARKRLPLRALSQYPDSGRVWDFGRIGVTGLPQVRARVRFDAMRPAVDPSAP